MQVMCVNLNSCLRALPREMAGTALFFARSVECKFRSPDRTRNGKSADSEAHLNEVIETERSARVWHFWQDAADVSLSKVAEQDERCLFQNVISMIPRGDHG